MCYKKYSVELPVLLIQSLANIKGFNKETFEQVHASGEQVTSVRINPAKPAKEFPNFQINEFPNSKIPWTQYGYYLQERPSFTFDPLFHAGTYYVQEASSMFVEQALLQTVDLSKPLKVLDLCASPGGKSTHLQSLISTDSLLVSNEVIRSRANVLKDNIIKWGSHNVVVTNNDPAHFSKLENYFDVIVIDAPCSGSGLFRRDEDAIEEWSINNVALCQQRQQRILADVWPALKQGGVVIYSTCSYSKQEDEDITDWIITELSAKPCELAVPAEWGIVTVTGDKGGYGYRFWPDKLKGEGFFIACFQKTGGDDDNDLSAKTKPTTATKNELAMIEKWVKPGDIHFIKYENTVYGWPQLLKDDFNYLLQQLRVIYSGTIIGELMRDKLVPDHALAMSEWVSTAVERTQLSYEKAIQYLQRKDLHTDTKTKGWQLASYSGNALGWMNVLQNRINNYYPKELRILKEMP